MMTKPLFQMSADARLLYQRLIRVPVDGTVTYADLLAEISRPVSGAFGALHTAVRRVRRDHDMVFAAVRGVGLHRLTDLEIVGAAAADGRSLRRRARVAAEKLTKVQDYAALPPRAQIEHTARLSIFAAIAEMSTDKAVDKVIAVASGRSGELPIAATLAAFGASARSA